jgi:hypothetical protein
MGAQVSVVKANTNIISKSIADSIVSNSKSCSTSSSQTQILRVGGDANIGGSVSFKQNSSIDLGCIQDNITSSQLSTNIANDLTNKLRAENSGQNIGGQLTMSSATTDLITDISNSIKVEDLQKCEVKNAQLTDNYIEGDLRVNGDYTFEQSFSSLTDCIQSNSTITNLTNSLANSVANDISASNVGFISAGAVILIAIIIIIAVIVGGYIFINSEQ